MSVKLLAHKVIDRKYALYLVDKPQTLVLQVSDRNVDLFKLLAFIGYTALTKIQGMNPKTSNDNLVSSILN